MRRFTCWFGVFAFGLLVCASAWATGSPMAAEYPPRLIDYGLLNPLPMLEVSMEVFSLVAFVILPLLALFAVLARSASARRWFFCRLATHLRIIEPPPRWAR